uniref:Uncharacterized protein n=1 Tax=Varanus komodoensis TaxID=61221 RepID=A0A8D2LDK1_VARKO
LLLYWMMSGLSYIRYSQISAKAGRAALNHSIKEKPKKAAVSNVKLVKPKKELHVSK